VIVAKHHRQLFSRYWTLAYWGRDLDLSRSCEVINHESRNRLIPCGPFPTGGPLEPSFYI